MHVQYTGGFDITALPSAPTGERWRFPKGPGIYFVLSADNAVLYIGRSQNIRDRWGGHHQKLVLRAIAGARLAWLSTSYHDDLIALERSFIDAIDPPLNDWHGGRYRRHGQLRLPM